MAAFDLDISYTQLAVFDSTLATPFNDWTDDHVDQGFAWRPGSVSFGTLESGGEIHINVFRSRELEERASMAERILVVPFTVPAHGAIEIASIGSRAVLDLQAGEYELTFEHGHDLKGVMWANFYFRPVESPVIPRILRADAELRPPAALVMTANPA
jgi:hypothetical protein